MAVSISYFLTIAPVYCGSDPPASRLCLLFYEFCRYDPVLAGKILKADDI